MPTTAHTQSEPGTARYQRFLPRLALFIVATYLLSASLVAALTPFPKPEPTNEVVSGVASPFEGGWAIIRPTMTMGEKDRELAICALPVRIEATGEQTMIYRQPRETRTGTEMTLKGANGGTIWTSTDGSESYFTFWVSKDGFYLYEKMPLTDAEWGWPHIYRRCP